MADCCKNIVSMTLQQVKLNNTVDSAVIKYIKHFEAEEQVIKAFSKDSVEFITHNEMRTLANIGGFVVKRTSNKKAEVTLGEHHKIPLAREELFSMLTPEQQEVRLRYGYLPWNWTYPDKVRVPCEHTATVTQPIRDVFINTIGNILYNGKLYAANCRHRVSQGDEHPWCLICLINANIPPKCGRSCYICAVMSETAISNRTILAEKYLGEIKEHGKITTAATLIRSDIHTQVEADLAEEDELGRLDWPKEWGTSYKGYVYSATRIPYHYPVSQGARFSHNTATFRDKLKRHFVVMKRKWREWKDKPTAAKPMPRKQVARRSAGKPGTSKQSEEKPNPRKRKADEVKTPSGEGDESEHNSEDDDSGPKTPPPKRRSHKRVPEVIRSSNHRLGAWKSKTNNKCTINTANNSRSENFDYSEASSAAQALQPDVGTLLPPAQYGTRSRLRTQLLPTQQVVKKINRAMRRYVNKPSIFKPDLKTTSRQHNDVTTVTKINPEVLVSSADDKGKYPTDNCLVYITQAELRRQEYLLRQQCRALEVNDRLITVLLNTFKDTTDPFNALIHSLADGIRNAHTVHMRTAPEMLGTTIQIRVRDNCIRRGYPKEEFDRQFALGFADYENNNQDQMRTSVLGEDAE